MNVTLKIENDAKLRDYIKLLIRNQVVSIVREEVKDVLKEVLFDKIKNNTTTIVDTMFKEKIEQAVNKALSLSSYTNETFVRREAKELIGNIVRKTFKESNWTNII